MKNKLYLALIILVVLLTGCSSTKSLERSTDYGKLNLLPPTAWDQSTIRDATIVIDDGKNKIEDNNWGIRKLETGNYIVRIKHEQYFNYGQIIKIRDDRVTDLRPKLNEYDSEYRIASKISSGSKFQAFVDGDWTNPFLAKGINLGLGKPNYFPGETAITKSEYKRWLELIGEMNANLIRVYTIHPPEFYEVLFEYNQNHNQPLYLLHGVWLEEESLAASNTVFNSELKSNFEAEMKDVIDIVHGQSIIESKPGYASGVYSKDISDYVLGYILGIEWDPYLVDETNKLNKADFNGQYFKTEQAQPFEIWLAKRMETAVDYEQEVYNKQRSISFTNWVTTDAIDTKTEANEPEDSQRLASINADHIKKKSDFAAGYFASYHAYPYYPEYINLKYNSDNYAQYLAELNSLHQVPILIAEFGLPSSRGKAHESAQPKLDQGFLSEIEQGQGIEKLYTDIVNEGLMGGVIFSWQDEYFKRTWNTKDYDTSNRRPYWPDIQTNEQFFGLLNFDVRAAKGIYIDGSGDGWNLDQPFYQRSDNSLIKKIYVNHNPEGLYLRIHYLNSIESSFPKTYVLLDTAPGVGQDNVLGKQLDQEIDFIVKLTDINSSKVLVAEDYDLFKYDYGDQLTAGDPDSNINGFNPIRLILKKGEELEFDYYETGKLLFGNGAANFNSLTDAAVKDNVLELRLPWGLLNFKDPSQKEVMGDFNHLGLESSEIIEGIKIRILADDNGQIVPVLPTNNSTVKEYNWDTWNRLRYQERKKESYDLVKELFGQF